ncbi:hypothetical protein ANO11243_029680 [Dothideomycetidae sp. 11243]|nr:hypothetical protein ANO11243_029680 [fungal sp. No.11243]
MPHPPTSDLPHRVASEDIDNGDDTDSDTGPAGTAGAQRSSYQRGSSVFDQSTKVNNDDKVAHVDMSGARVLATTNDALDSQHVLIPIISSPVLDDPAPGLVSSNWLYSPHPYSRRECHSLERPQITPLERSDSHLRPFASETNIASLHHNAEDPELHESNKHLSTSLVSRVAHPSALDGANETLIDASMLELQSLADRRILMPRRRRSREVFDCGSRHSGEKEADPMYYQHLMDEVDSRWILNLSVQFRDRTRHEKYFITYAERPNFWRRVTVVWDYDHLRDGSLEKDLMSMRLERDKNIRLYEALRVSLFDIQFFDTVTQIALKTEEDDRLHIYVTEDLGELIQYPSIKRVKHIECPHYREEDVIFQLHLSGFVSKVLVESTVLVRKEIPANNNIEEFLYELNALNALQHSKSVIRLRGIVTDNKGKHVKGLVIAYASRGNLADLLYERRGASSPKISWSQRLKWAQQILLGLSDIHEAGFVHGDFTLSNIVLDHDNNAAIIDLNRRGCPVGWEPPELMQSINSKQRVAMMIGVKTDIYQLGMCLYALGEHDAEPEHKHRSGFGDLTAFSDKKVPEWYRRMTSICLSKQPQDRGYALELLHAFDGMTPSYARKPHRPIVPDHGSSGYHADEFDLTDAGLSSGFDDPRSHEERSEGPSVLRSVGESKSKGKATDDGRSKSKHSRGSHINPGGRSSTSRSNLFQPDWSFDACDLPPQSGTSPPPRFSDPNFDEGWVSFADDSDRYFMH